MDVRCLTVGELVQQPALLSQFDDPLGFLKSCDSAWLQMLASNPYGRNEDLALVLALSGRTAAGRLGFYAAPAFYGGREHRTHWMSGFFVDAEARKTGVGAVMLLQAMRRCPSLLASGGPTEPARKLYAAAGLIPLPRLQRYVGFYRAHPIVARYVRNRVVRNCIVQLATPLLGLYSLCRRPQHRNQLAFRAVDRFGAELDALPSPPEPNYFPKPSKLLNWVLAHRPRWAFEIWRQSRLVGYCLLDRYQAEGGVHALPFMTIGRLMDFYLMEAQRDDELALLSFAHGFFRDQNADVFECQVHGRFWTQRCRQFGFIHVGGNYIFFRPVPAQPWDPAANWWLTLGTSDVLLD